MRKNTNRSGWRRVRAGIGAAACLLALAMAAGTAQGSSWHLDPSFGSGGRVILGAPQLKDSFFEFFQPFLMTVRPDGDILIARQETVFLFKADGRLDASFAQGGELRVPTSPTQALWTIEGLAIDSEGRILLAGTTRPAASSKFSQFPTSAVIERLLPDGQPDPEFGAGGILVTKFGMPVPKTVNLAHHLLVPAVPVEFNEPVVAATGIAVDGEDRPIVVGNAAFESVLCENYEYMAYDGQTGPAYVARLTVDGQPDPSFGQGGVQTAAADSTAASPLVDAGGIKLLLKTDFACPERVLELPTSLVTINPDGTPQTQFRPQPRLGSPFAAVVDGAGKTLLLGEGPGIEEAPLRLTLLNSDGSLDTGFGSRGHRTIRVHGEQELTSFAVDGRHRPLVVGSGDGDFLLRGYTAAGRIDPGFGRRGQVLTRFGTGSEAEGLGVLPDRGGHIVVGGLVIRPKASPRFALALARYVRSR
jgi:uncharacterized delta-60 repeat protein